MRLPSPDLGKLLKQLKKFFHRNKLPVFLAILPLLFLFLEFYFYIIPTFKKLKNTQEIILKKEKQLEQLEDKLKAKPPNLSQFSDYKTKIFTGQDPNAILYALQKEFESLPGLTITSFRLSKKVPLGKKLEKVRVYFRLEGDIKTLVELLNLLENEPKALKITSLRIFPRLSSKKETLFTEIEVEALWMKL